MKQVEQQRFNNNWTYLQKVWVHEKTKHKLDNWVLRSMETTDKAGLCNYNNQTIYISTVFLRGHNCNYQKAKQVLMHEIAHALTPGSSHNDRWKEKCKELKGDDRMAVTMVSPGMNWAVSCSHCKWRQEYPSKPHVNGMVCGKCRTTIKVKYIQ